MLASHCLLIVAAKAVRMLIPFIASKHLPEVLDMLVQDVAGKSAAGDFKIGANKAPLGGPASSPTFPMHTAPINPVQPSKERLLSIQQHGEALVAFKQSVSQPNSVPDSPSVQQPPKQPQFNVAAPAFVPNAAAPAFVPKVPQPAKQPLAPGKQPVQPTKPANLMEKLVFAAEFVPQKLRSVPKPGAANQEQQQATSDELSAAAEATQVATQTAAAQSSLQTADAQPSASSQLSPSEDAQTDSLAARSEQPIVAQSSPDVQQKPQAEQEFPEDATGLAAPSSQAVTVGAQASAQTRCLGTRLVAHSEQLDATHAHAAVEPNPVDTRSSKPENGFSDCAPTASHLVQLEAEHSSGLTKAEELADVAAATHGFARISLLMPVDPLLLDFYTIRSPQTRRPVADKGAYTEHAAAPALIMARIDTAPAMTHLSSSKPLLTACCTAG